VRELCNEVERAVVRATPGQPLTPDRFSDELLHGAGPGNARAPDRPGASLKEQLEELERQIIRRTLDRLGGKRVAAAKELGLTRQGLGKKIDRLGGI